MPSAEKEFSVWEGEIVPIRDAVGRGRVIVSQLAVAASDLFRVDLLQSHMHQSVSATDDVMVRTSSFIVQQYASNPWLVPSACISGASLFVFSKSMRWGLVAATRNSAVVCSLLTLVIFPYEIRHACSLCNL